MGLCLLSFLSSQTVVPAKHLWDDFTAQKFDISFCFNSVFMQHTGDAKLEKTLPVLSAHSQVCEKEN